VPSNKRPYVQNSIVQLEQLFAKSNADPMAVGQIEDELSFRKTDCAAKLSLRAQEFLLSPAASMSRPATAELMAEIDEVSAEHGGWPNAFRGMMD